MRTNATRYDQLTAFDDQGDHDREPEDLDQRFDCLEQKQVRHSNTRAVPKRGRPNIGQGIREIVEQPVCQRMRRLRNPPIVPGASVRRTRREQLHSSIFYLWSEDAVDAHRHLHVLPERGPGEPTQGDQNVSPEHAEAAADDQEAVHFGPGDPGGRKGRACTQGLASPPRPAMTPEPPPARRRFSIRSPPGSRRRPPCRSRDGFRRGEPSGDGVRLQQAVRVAGGILTGREPRDSRIERTSSVTVAAP